MSGPTMTESQPEPTSTQNGADPAAPTTDAAASLRALALSTLKRRKAATTHSPDHAASLPSRPIFENNIQLDYGSSEPSTSGAFAISSSSPGPFVAPKPAQSAPPLAPASMDVDDDQTREEGEISDSEPTSPPPRPPQSSPKVPMKPQPGALNLPVKPAPTAATPSAQQAKTDTVVRTPTNALTSLPSQQTAGEARQFSPSSDHGTVVSGDYQIRPGLHMSQAAYNTARDIILDLLGWGVSSEYLLSCGLSRELIYFVFIEHNLRLPATLDIAGLPSSPAAQPVRYASPEPISPPAASSSRHRSQSRSINRPYTGHPSLPQKPRAPQGLVLTEGSSLLAGATPFVPASSPGATSIQSSPSAPSTIDLELQRRQELLARKAVLASRKSRQAPAAPATSRASLESRISEPTDVGMTSPTSSVPRETVDDFLKTIGSVAGGPSAGEDDMDVDEPIPGLSNFPAPRERSGSPSRSPQIRADSVASTVSPSNVPFPPAANISPADPATQRPSAEPEIVGDYHSHGDERRDVSVSREDSLSFKRGTKRPVAADFVDVDIGPPRSHYHGYNDHHHGRHGHHPRKRPQSFAGLTGHRRMVINLSDTSDDEDDEDEPDAKRSRPDRSYRTREPPRLGASATVPTLGTTVSLEEKEKEIQKMKELIAKRERARLAKFANSARSTPPTPAVGDQPRYTTTSVKQEEDDVAVSASLNHILTSLNQTVEDVQPVGDSLSTPISSSLQSSASNLASPIDIPQSTDDPAGSKDSHVEQDPAAATASLPVAATSNIETQEVTEDNDVDDASSSEPPSTQVDVIEDDDMNTDFASYRSPLSSYPLLRAHSPRYLPDPDPLAVTNFRALAVDAYPSTRPESPDPSVLTGVDLRSVKAAAVNKWLSDPSRRICQYEVPGGGECRDPHCEDIHPSQAWMVEPSDHETAQHLLAALPKRSQMLPEQLEAALQQARQPGVGYLLRVRNALDMFGLRIAP